MLNSGKIDPHDPFDQLLFVEEKLHQDGYIAGFNIGKMEGEHEGYALGLHHGMEIGKEIGFYKGFVNTWLVLINNDSKKRQRKTLEQMHDLLSNFVCNDPETADVQEKLALIRTKFKQLSVVLKIPTELKKGDQPGINF